MTFAEPKSVALCLASLAGHLGPFDPSTDALLDQPLDATLEWRYRTLIGAEPDPAITYLLAKRGVIRLCERATVLWGARGARVMSISPGLIDTAMGRLELQHHPMKEWMAELTPVGGTERVPTRCSLDC